MEIKGIKKAWPEIQSAFRTMGTGDPLQFHDTGINIE